MHMTSTELDIKTLEGWLWDAACKIRGEIDAPKYKDYILPLIFLKRLSDVFDDEEQKLSESYGDFNATAAGQRIISDDKLKILIDVLGRYRLGMTDVEPDILGRAYEYLLRKFAEGSGQSAGEFYTPREVAILMSYVLDPEPNETIYDPCCGSGGLLIKCYLRFRAKYDAQIMLINGSKLFQKGRPKNYLPDDSIKQISDIYLNGEETVGISKIITTA